MSKRNFTSVLILFEFPFYDKQTNVSMTLSFSKFGNFFSPNLENAFKITLLEPRNTFWQAVFVTGTGLESTTT